MTPQNTDDPVAVTVIIGSTRQGRVGDTIGHWFVGRARRHGTAITVVDLADFDLPCRYPERPTPPVVAFTSTLAAAEAFVLVTPEYNHSFPASVKLAIDYGYDEWHAKPVGLVSYGCQTGGLHAVAHLRAVFAELHAVTMRTVVAIDLLDGAGRDGGGNDGGGSDTGVDADVHTGFPGRGSPAGDRTDRAVTSMLDQLDWWGRALRDARAARPYVG